MSAGFSAPADGRSLWFGGSVTDGVCRGIAVANVVAVWAGFGVGMDERGTGKNVLTVGATARPVGKRGVLQALVGATVVCDCGLHVAAGNRCDATAPLVGGVS